MVPASLWLTMVLSPAPATKDFVCDTSQTWASPPQAATNSTTWGEDLGLEWPDFSWMCLLCGTATGAAVWDWGWTIIYPVAFAFYYMFWALWAFWGVLTWVPEGVTYLDEVTNQTSASLAECVHAGSLRILQLYGMAFLDGVSGLLAASVITSALLKFVPQAAQMANDAERDGIGKLSPRWLSGCWSWVVDAVSAGSKREGAVRRPGDGAERHRIGLASDESRRVSYPELDVNKLTSDTADMLTVLTSLDGAGFGVAQRLLLIVAIELVQPTMVSGIVRFLLSNPTLVRIGMGTLAVARGPANRAAWGLLWALFELVVVPGATFFGIASSEVATVRLLTEGVAFGLFVVAIILAVQLLDGPAGSAEIEKCVAAVGACIVVSVMQHLFGFRGLLATLFTTDGLLVSVGGAFLALIVVVPAMLAFVFAAASVLAVTRQHLSARLQPCAHRLLRLAEPHLATLAGPVWECVDEAFQRMGVGFVVAAAVMAGSAVLMVLLHPFDDPQIKGARELLMFLHPQPLWQG